jgi:hypothetical protein
MRAEYLIQRLYSMFYTRRITTNPVKADLITHTPYLHFGAHNPSRRPLVASPTCLLCHVKIAPRSMRMTIVPVSGSVRTYHICSTCVPSGLSAYARKQSNSYRKIKATIKGGEASLARQTLRVKHLAKVRMTADLLLNLHGYVHLHPSFDELQLVSKESQ